MKPALEYATRSRTPPIGLAQFAMAIGLGILYAAALAFTTVMAIASVFVIHEEVFHRGGTYLLRQPVAALAYGLFALFLVESLDRFARLVGPRDLSISQRARTFVRLAWFVCRILIVVALTSLPLLADRMSDTLGLPLFWSYVAFCFLLGIVTSLPSRTSNRPQVHHHMLWTITLLSPSWILIVLAQVLMHQTSNRTHILLIALLTPVTLFLATSTVRRSAQRLARTY